MLLRKYLCGGRIIEVVQIPWERIVAFNIEVYAPEKGLCRRSLILEMLGRRSNLILVDDNLLILDALKRLNGDREIGPGQIYLRPAAPTPWNPEISASDLQILLDRAPATQLLKDFLRNELMGISPFTVLECLSRTGYTDTVQIGVLASDAGIHLKKVLQTLIEESMKPTPRLITDVHGMVKDFSAYSITQQEISSTPAPNLNEIIIQTLHAWDQESIRLNERSELSRFLKERISKLLKKAGKQSEELSAAEDADQFRISGDILSIHVNSIKKGQTKISLPNYYDVDYKEISISLRPDLTPSENIQHYFKKYQKAKKGQIAIEHQLNLTHEEISYLQGILATLEDNLTTDEIWEIRNELTEEGYLKKSKLSHVKRKTTSSPRRFISSDGIPIDVGRNNFQNDRLTLKISSPKDIWFHTQGIPGSHVLVRTDGQPLPDRTLLEAAHLAAWFSQARNSTKIPVDYTERRHVKKPAGSRPGFVLYQPFQTVTVTPDPAVLVRIGVETD
jgi:predicted ribosome quality control (RQC) complex YloA/Tae2 family protein